MNILGFDVTGPVMTVGATFQSRVLAREDRPAEKGRGNLLEGAIDSVLGTVGWTRRSVDGLALLVGPGSLTATRIGWATAAGWSQSRGIPVAGWTLHQAHRRRRDGPTQGVTCCVHYRGDAFLLYDLNDPVGDPVVVMLIENAKAPATPRILTGPGILGNRDRWKRYLSGGTQIADDDEAIIGGDTLALWGEEAISQGDILDLARSPLDYGIPPDFRKIVT